MHRISPGATGPAVADVQRRLRSIGLTIDDDEGTYGASTAHTVRMFQRDRKLMAHGIVDDDTWIALVDAGHALGDRLLYVTRPPLRGDDVRELQRGLSRLGFDTGTTDGIHGEDTDAALREFQHNAGIAVDGIAGAATLGTLASLRRRHQAATTFEVLDVHDEVTGPATLTGCRIAVDPSSAHADVPVGDDGLRCRDVVLDVARRLVGQLNASGATASLTSTLPPGAEPTVSERALFANELGVDAVLSVGCTLVAEPAAEGVTAHHFGDGVVTSRRGRQLATMCLEEVTDRTGALDCDVHPSTAGLLRESRAPAATVEIGFLSNEREADRLAESAYRHAIASGLAAGLRRWTAAT